MRSTTMRARSSSSPTTARLIELVADRLWLTADGHIKPFAGDMDDYARFVLDRAKTAIRAPARDTEHLAAPQKTASDAYNAARKAAKKKRRRGY